MRVNTVCIWGPVVGVCASALTSMDKDPLFSFGLIIGSVVTAGAVTVLALLEKDEPDA